VLNAPLVTYCIFIGTLLTLVLEIGSDHAPCPIRLDTATRIEIRESKLREIGGCHNVFIGIRQDSRMPQQSYIV
jgi:hypothetical protein